MIKRQQLARRVPLTRSQIVEAALEILDQDGPDALSMRRLAAHLGVEAMSLYNHVGNKRDLLEAVVNLVLARIPLPDKSLPWRERLEMIVMALYRALLARPSLVILLANETAALGDPDVLASMESILEALAESGLAADRQVSAFRGMIAMCFGFVVAHTRGFSSTKAESEASWSQWDGAKWQEASLPHLARLAPFFLSTRADDDLRFMLTAYLDALQRPA